MRFDWVVPCPYCGRASSLFGDRALGTLSHHCQECGAREVPPEIAAISWARSERRLREIADAGLPDDAGLIEPMFRKGGVWYGRWTREPREVPAMPEGCCDRFAGEAGE